MQNEFLNIVVACDIKIPDYCLETRSINAKTPYTVNLQNILYLDKYKGRSINKLQNSIILLVF